MSGDTEGSEIIRMEELSEDGGGGGGVGGKNDFARLAVGLNSFQTH